MYNECRHIMPSGVRCKSPALRNLPFCYFHSRLHRGSTQQSSSQDVSLEIPFLEDRSAIQIAVTEVLSALGSERLDTRRAGLILYGLQIASQNTTNFKNAVSKHEIVRSMNTTSDGESVAPENFVCEPTDYCDECPHKDDCEDYDGDDEEDED